MILWAFCLAFLLFSALSSAVALNILPTTSNSFSPSSCNHTESSSTGVPAISAAGTDDEALRSRYSGDANPGKTAETLESKP
ncbi:hypothetical protein KCV07_g213, partial [Aureobasidium melanogenum]